MMMMSLGNGDGKMRFMVEMTVCLSVCLCLCSRLFFRFRFRSFIKKGEDPIYRYWSFLKILDVRVSGMILGIFSFEYQKRAGLTPVLVCFFFEKDELKRLGFIVTKE